MFLSMHSCTQLSWLIRPALPAKIKLMLMCAFQFGMVETVRTGLIDAYPAVFGRHKVLFTAGLCFATCLGGLLFVSNVSIWKYKMNVNNIKLFLN